MLILPRSNPLYEQIPTNRAKLPDMLKKMGNGGFTGYISYLLPTAEAYALFAQGALISVLLQEGQRRRTGFDALTALFDLTLRQGGQFSIYRMTTDIAMCTHALLQGEQVLQPQEVRMVDLKTVLERMKLQSLNGTVLFATAERNAMIFYKEGQPIGFYHDTSREVETSALVSQQVAALPGATVEIRSTPPATALMLHNLLEMVNIDRLWETALKRSSASPVPAAGTPAPATKADQSKQLQELADDLNEIVVAYLSRQGSAMLERLLTAAGGTAVLLDTEKTAALLADVTNGALAIDPEAKVGEMVDLMRSEIAGRLSV